MKKTLFVIAIFLIISCGGLSKILNAGSVETTDYNETIAFNYDHNFALIAVEINSKSYTFLVDTGAPTVISTAIFEDLNIERADYIAIQDSQGQINGQEVVVVPQIKIGDLVYTNIGAVVADLRNVFEFDCMGIDGIIGANQMAKSYWEFDYQNKEITITDQFTNYDLSSYHDTIAFAVSSQRTPYITGYANGLKTTFAYDTGFAGYIDVNENLGEFNESLGFTKYGSSGVGLYDAVDSTRVRTVKLDSLRIGSIEMSEQVVDLDHGGLIGNDFMNKHDILIDWFTQKIYLKKIKDYEKTEQKSFGFSFRIKENKAVVIAIIEEIDTGLRLGDELLSINEYDFRNITDSTACEKYRNIKLEEVETLNITYLRDGVEYQTKLENLILIE